MNGFFDLVLIFMAVAFCWIAGERIAEYIVFTRPAAKAFKSVTHGSRWVSGGLVWHIVGRHERTKTVAIALVDAHTPRLLVCPANFVLDLWERETEISE